MALLDAKQRGLTLTEVLALHHLPDDGLTFDETFEPAWLDDQLGLDRGPTAFHCEPEPKAHLEVQAMGPVATMPPILIRGNIDVRLKSTCVRCLAEVIVGCSLRVEQMLFPRTGKEASDEESLEVLDEGSYTKAGVDLPEVVREAILLELTTNPTCEDEPACDVRTQQIIEDVNAKNHVAVDPRWAALQDLMKKAPES